jgi:hypothetical protein
MEGGRYRGAASMLVSEVPMKSILHFPSAAAVAAAAMFSLSLPAGGIEHLAAAPTVVTRVPQREEVTSALTLPFTSNDVVQYFSTVLEMSPEKAANGAMVFENYQVAHPEDRWRIAVWLEGRGVVVEFTVGGDYGMNLAREFFECPLFVPAESEEFYAMLNQARNAPVQRMPRFTVAMTFDRKSDLEMLVMRFTPRDAL